MANDKTTETASAPQAAILDKMRLPFPPHQISKLPKPTAKQTQIVKDDFSKGIRCKICGSWHHPDVVHLDYVGHAALTDRLLDVDPTWSWEPIADPVSHGLPVSPGGMWIKLTVCGVSRYGFGHPDGKTGGDAVKETIGDALRNAAMRFGAALDLWHKGDLHGDDTAIDDASSETAKTTPKAEPKVSKPPTPPTLAERANRLEAAMRSQVGYAAKVQKAFDLGAGLCAELDDKDPERLAELNALLKMLLAAPDAEEVFS